MKDSNTCRKCKDRSRKGTCKNNNRIWLGRQSGYQGLLLCFYSYDGLFNSVDLKWLIKFMLDFISLQRLPRRVVTDELLKERTKVVFCVLITLLTAKLQRGFDRSLESCNTLKDLLEPCTYKYICGELSDKGQLRIMVVKAVVKYYKRLFENRYVRAIWFIISYFFST